MHRPCSGTCDGHGTGHPCDEPCICGCHRFPRGVWVDELGLLHFDLPEMVRGCGFEPTPKTVLVMERVARQLAAEWGATVVEDDD